MPRFKDVNWTLPATKEGVIQSWEMVKIALLMDIRDELKEQNRMLRAIRRNTAWSRKKGEKSS